MNAVREAVEGAIDAGVRHLTLFAFSSENWSRPRPEVDALMALLEEFIDREIDALAANGVRVCAIGDISRLSAGPRAALDRLVSRTAACSRLNLYLCISYSARAEIVEAARRTAADVAAGRLSPEDIDAEGFGNRLYTAGIPDPDLLVRTSGELRVSNFLLWQLAYTEIFVTPVLWPDFTRETLFEAIAEYQRRERRFGSVTA